MIFTAGNILLIGSILLFVSIIVGKTGYRFGVPALLLFLVVGMLFGSDVFYRIKFVCFEDETYSKEDKKRINSLILRRNEVDKR